MSENLEKRKSDLIADLNGRYANKRGRWWPENRYAYTGTIDLAKKCMKFDNNATEITIRPRLIYVFICIVFFLVGIVIQVVPMPGFATVDFNPLFLIIFGAGFIYFVIRGFNRKPRMIINTDGIWTNKLNTLISWKDIVATFIHRAGDDGDFCYLLIHYFESETDQFKETEYRVDELDITNEELAFYIEKFKLQHKPATPI